MLIDRSGMLGAEHARDLRRAADAYRLGHVGHTAFEGFREFVARGLLGPVDNYRAR
jgi:hypothetical protein